VVVAMMATIFLPQQRHAAATQICVDFPNSGCGFERGGL
jgi:hypothetical protein